MQETNYGTMLAEDLLQQDMRFGFETMCTDYGSILDIVHYDSI